MATTEYDIVYNKHCSKCQLRHTPNCYFSKCSVSTYGQWLNEGRTIMTNKRKRESKP